MQPATRALIALGAAGAVLALAPLAGIAQPGPTLPPGGAVGTGPAVPSAAALPAPVPLTAGGRDLLARSLQAQSARSAMQSLPRDSLTQAGLSADNDAVERAIRVGGRWTAPPNIGLAAVGAASPVAIDPAVAASARIAAHRRAGREPTAAEVAREIAAFDAGIARINRDLSARRTEIAAAYKQTGRYPRDLEAGIFGVPSRAAEAVNPSAEVRAGLQRLVTILFNSQARDRVLPAPGPASLPTGEPQPVIPRVLPQ